MGIGGEIVVEGMFVLEVTISCLITILEKLKAEVT